MDFKEMKDRIRITDVLLRYRVPLRFGEQYASCACPLPTHPPDDRGNNAFGIHLPTNRWQCKHKDCARINGVGNKWGDCINLVMTMDRLDYKPAAQKLDRWFPTEYKKPAPNGSVPAAGRGERPSPTHTVDTSPAIAGQGGQGYMREARVEIENLLTVISDEVQRKQIVKAVMNKIHESFTNGRRGV